MKKSILLLPFVLIAGASASFSGELFPEAEEAITREAQRIQTAFKKRFPHTQPFKGDYALLKSRVLIEGLVILISQPEENLEPGELEEKPEENLEPSELGEKPEENLEPSELGEKIEEVE